MQAQLVRAARNTHRKNLEAENWGLKGASARRLAGERGGVHFCLRGPRPGSIGRLSGQGNGSYWTQPGEALGLACYLPCLDPRIFWELLQGGFAMAQRPEEEQRWG